MHALSTPSIQQRHIRVRGVVQGVGFRPFVYRVATELGLKGWVRNDGEGVEIAVRGNGEAVNTLLLRLQSEAPPLARVEQIELIAAIVDETSGFEIRASLASGANTGISSDAAICPDCVRDMFDPGNRRYRYPFTNCTHCGPRYTLTRALPYDRPNTSMAAFALCTECEAEYHAPLDRRFHAQPNACPVCGPQVWLADNAGNQIEVEEPIAAALQRIEAGEILAVKGLGGFHLICGAQNATAVARLRARKQREEKPFAVMFANSASITRWASMNDEERALLESRERPIVLLRKGTDCNRTFAGVAPDVAWLGALLPYTPIHYLLFHEAARRPHGTAWLDEPQPLTLVCTSANPGGEPLVTNNEEAVHRLTGIADAFLLHDREILIRCDDSVVRATNAECSPCGRPAPGPKGSSATATFIRRARGYTPRAITLPHSGPSVLACGAWFKNTICLTRGNQAFLSQHIGDLNNAPTCTALEEAVDHLRKVLEIAPAVVAHDRHPDFYSSRFAANFAAQHGLPLIAVQHHHAHIAAVLAEHHYEGTALGVALDGVGLGSDGTAWGGELLQVNGSEFTRLGHLRSLSLPGGDRASREPWRVAASALFALGKPDEIARRWPGAASSAVRDMLERNLNTPHTTSAGRWFDAAAGVLGIATHMSFEGQAAMRLEGLAEEHGPIAPMADGFVLNTDGTLDLLPLIAALAAMNDARYGAALFHSTLIDALAEWIKQAAANTNIHTIALGGGCFLNHILSRRLVAKLEVQGLRVLQAHQAPPNDGGIALGQAWVAMQSLKNKKLNADDYMDVVGWKCREHISQTQRTAENAEEIRSGQRS